MIDRSTGLPYPPNGFYWYLEFKPESGRFPYALILKREGEDQPYRSDYWERRALVYAEFLNPATGSTIRPRHVRKAAREVLKKYQRFKKTQAENESGSNRVKTGAYPPNRLGS